MTKLNSKSTATKLNWMAYDRKNHAQLLENFLKEAQLFLDLNSDCQMVQYQQFLAKPKEKFVNHNLPKMGMEEMINTIKPLKYFGITDYCRGGHKNYYSNVEILLVIKKNQIDSNNQAAKNKPTKISYHYFSENDALKNQNILQNYAVFDDDAGFLNWGFIHNQNLKKQSYKIYQVTHSN